MYDDANERHLTNGKTYGPGTALGANGVAWGRNEDPAPEAEVSAPVALHRLFRGRYRWAILFVGLGLGAGMVAGFKSGSRVFRSTAQIRVVSVLPQVLYKDDEKNLVPVFDAFADAQTQLIKSQRVIQAAMTNPAWAALGRPTGEGAVAAFQGSLEAERKLEIISVHINEQTPEAAVAGVRSLIKAYREIYDADDRENREHRLELLEKHKNALTQDLQNVRTAQTAISSAFQADDLQALHDAKLETVKSMDQSRRNAEFEKSAASDEVGMLPEQHFSPYLNERLRLQQRLSELLIAGLAEEHPQVVNIKAAMERVDQMINVRVRRASADGAPTYDAAKGELGSLSAQLRRLSDLRSDEEVVKQQIAETRKRIYQLHVEDGVNNRIVLMADGEKPLGPYRDTRKTFAAAGMLGGGLIGFGLAACFCLIDRRFRDPHDLALGANHNPVLATIPRLSIDLANSEPARRAALAVHQMRMLLHARGGRGAGAFAVTSAGPGAGKTSVTLGLGVSFASSGSRTLLIDLDLSGAGLTSSVGCERPQQIGRLMQRRGMLTEGQLAEASSLTEPGLRFGEACVQLGMASEEDVSHALRAQAGSRVGVMEALSGQPLAECVADAGVNRLSILPLGGATAEHAASLSLSAVTRLIDEARRQYDVVLVDTGPLFGSLEASVVCGAVDGTVLVVSRGEERSRARKGKELLQTFRAPLAGVVFNRAEAHELSPVALPSGAGPSSVWSNTHKAENNTWGKLRRFGPVAWAVARHVPGEAEWPTAASRASGNGVALHS